MSVCANVTLETSCKQINVHTYVHTNVSNIDARTYVICTYVCISEMFYYY